MKAKAVLHNNRAPTVGCHGGGCRTEWGRKRQVTDPADMHEVYGTQRQSETFSAVATAVAK